MHPLSVGSRWFCFLGRKPDRDLEWKFSLSEKEAEIELREVLGEFTRGWKENPDQIHLAKNGRYFRHCRN